MVQGIEFSRQRHTAIITLSRPEALNALSLEMILALKQQLHAFEEDDSIHAVIIQAKPSRAFCAGGDVRWLYEAGLRKDSQQLEFFYNEYQLNYLIAQFKKPYIALMDGMTMGGGVGVSLHGRFAVASEHFVFAMPETSIGFFPDIGASYLLSRSPGKMGIFLGLSGHRLNAAQAKACQLIHSIVPCARFPELLDALIGLDLTENAAERVQRCIAEYAAPADEQAMAHLPLAAINECFSAADMETILHNLDKHADAQMQHIATTLRHKAPLSLKVTLSQLLQAQTLSLAQCLQMDYTLVQHFMRDNDFYEGVRALLVDKDKTPHWQPAVLEAVSEALVYGYFAGGEPLHIED